jgi:hypothetical protein
MAPRVKRAAPPPWASVRRQRATHQIHAGACLPPCPHARRAGCCMLPTRQATTRAKPRNHRHNPLQMSDTNAGSSGATPAKFSNTPCTGAPPCGPASRSGPPCLPSTAHSPVHSTGGAASEGRGGARPRCRGPTMGPGLLPAWCTKPGSQRLQRPQPAAAATGIAAPPTSCARRFHAVAPTSTSSARHAQTAGPAHRPGRHILETFSKLTAGHTPRLITQYTQTAPHTRARRRRSSNWLHMGACLRARTRRACRPHAPHNRASPTLHAKAPPSKTKRTGAAARLGRGRAPPHTALQVAISARTARQNPRLRRGPCSIQGLQHRSIRAGAACRGSRWGAPLAHRSGTLRLPATRRLPNIMVVERVMDGQQAAGAGGCWQRA